MNSYVLSRSEAIDLFIKIVAKCEGKGRQDIENDLLAYLGKYRRSTVSSKAADLVLRPIAEELGSTQYYPNFLRDLSVEIKSGLPLSRTENRFELMLKCIGEENEINQYQIINAQNKKQDALQGSCWRMYSSSCFPNKQTQEKTLQITRDSIALGHFGYAVFITTKSHEGNYIGQQDYNGQYYIRNNRYLFVDAHLTGSKDKEIRIVADIGAGNVHVGHIFSGYYLNASSNLYFGPLLLERVEKQNSLTAQIFHENDPEIDEYIWDFFAKIKTIPDRVQPSFGAKTAIKKFGVVS